MPSLRDLSLERDQELNQLRARINQLGKTGKEEANDFVGLNISNEPVYDTVIQTGQSLTQRIVLYKKLFRRRNKKRVVSHILSPKKTNISVTSIRFAKPAISKPN